jgi:hypothetical protein
MHGLAACIMTPAPALMTPVASQSHFPRFPVSATLAWSIFPVARQWVPKADALESDGASLRNMAGRPLPRQKVMHARSAFAPEPER